MGTIIGGIFGSLFGAIGGSMGAYHLVDAIGDSHNYDVEIIICKECESKFKVRHYLGEHNNMFCVDCDIKSMD